MDKEIPEEIVNLLNNIRKDLESAMYAPINDIEIILIDCIKSIEESLNLD